MKTKTVLIFIFLTLLVIAAPHIFSLHSVEAQESSSQSQDDPDAPPEKETVPIPPDEFNRGTPRSSVQGFINAARDKDYPRAAEYLDLRFVSYASRALQGTELVRQLGTIFERAIWLDISSLSQHPEGKKNDGLPVNQDLVGKVETDDKTFNILLQRIPRTDGVLIWKFSTATVHDIPQMYRLVGYGPIGEFLSKILPDIKILGIPSWELGTLIIFALLAYLAARILMRLLEFVIKFRKIELSENVKQFIYGPVRFLLFIVIFRTGIEIMKPSVVVTALLRAETLLVIAIIWALIKSLDLLLESLIRRLKQIDQENIIALLRPLNNILKAMLILLGFVIWLDNLGFKISTLVAGLGIGGAAIALAAQDTLKNIFGSLMLILDKPFLVGQRIIAKGHDGVVEEIGVRSTKLRLLSGHQAIIPNEEMAKIDIENIGRRPYIKRSANIRLAYDTPLEKVDKAVEIIRTILENHEGLHSDFPPRVYFNEFNPDSLNILLLYWYHPPNYWDFLALNQRVNVQIMQEFEEEGIRFALPSTTTYLDSRDQHSLLDKLGGENESKGSED